ncbi:hypothetical protein SDC9_197200 [bioreactor metagenome]|uniref:Cysteine desulfurase n=1 Tax=bioreactor metagenome TaxID=1076179 RepID=A0A645IE33_9ZZZZ|nr:hypothetical protein [Proteiniphilum sp.]
MDVYLDYNATSPVNPSVYQEIVPYLTIEYGNPSNTYALEFMQTEKSQSILVLLLPTT